MSTAYIQAANLSLEEKLVMEAIRADLAATESTTAAADVATIANIQANAAYSEALAISTEFHALKNERHFAATAVPVAVGGAGTETAGELAAIYARVNQIKADVLAHIVAVGTRTVRGEHKAAAANTATLTAVPAATSVATACTLMIAIDVAIKNHGTESGVHFHDDSTLNGYTVSSNLLAGNATADKCRIEANAVNAAMKTHADAAYPL
jgi:hypothetical protein